MSCTEMDLVHSQNGEWVREAIETRRWHCWCAPLKGLSQAAMRANAAIH